MTTFLDPDIKILYCRNAGQRAVGNDHHVFEKLLEKRGGPQIAAHTSS
jgi:hypothetical protein|tara:strand:- start:620 stop:763 length:144 start_codon:yes stop_codon:yes gene_type:complete